MRRRLLVTGTWALLAAASCTGGGDGGAGDGGSAGEPLGGDAAPGEAVQLVAPEEQGAGETPTFEWEPVEGASTYRLVVLNAEGQATWAWEGAETSVPLGGVADRPEGSEGPVLTPGSSWSVAALDAEGHVLAASELRPVSP